MISTFAVAYATEGEHLVATEGDPGDSEARIVIDMPTDFTLGDLETLSWSIYTVSGYPAHVDITLDTSDPKQSMLTAELAVSNPSYTYPPSGPYGEWLKTFEMASDDGFGVINDDTVFWVTKLGSGDLNAPYSTLEHWKTGTVDGDPILVPGADEPYFDTEEVEIGADTPVLKMEIEVDNWILDTEVWIKDIQVNGVSTDLLLEVAPPIVSIMVSPASVDFGKLKYLDTAHEEITISNIGDVDVTINIDTTNLGTFFTANLEITGPGQIASSEQGTVNLDLTIPWASTPDVYSGTLVFEATPVPPEP